MIFIIFQTNSGYVFTHPLLPLVSYPNLLNVIHIIAIWPATICLIIFQFYLSLFLYYKNLKYIFFALIFLLPFFININNHINNNHILINNNHILSLSKDNPNNKTGEFQKGVNTDALTRAVLFSPLLPSQVTFSPYDKAQEIKQEILNLLSKKPASKVILFPESTYPFALNKFPEVINWWFCDLQNKNIHILIGSHRKDSGKTYNTVYHLHAGKIVNYYDKTDLMFFTEFLPHFWGKIPPIKQLFLSGTPPFCPGERKNTRFTIENQQVTPFICSDLFLLKKSEPACPILLFLNISWFSVSYIKNLMHLFVRFKSLELNTQIIPVSREI